MWEGPHPEQQLTCLGCGLAMLARFRTMCPECAARLDFWADVKKAEQQSIIQRNLERKKQLELEEREEKKRKRKSSRTT